MSKPPTKGRRLLKLAGMTAQVAGGYASSRLQSLFSGSDRSEAVQSRAATRSGEVIARTLGELKGAVMKVGQMASVAAELLPKEVAEALTSLQREAPPMPFDVIAQQLASEFGADPSTLFARIDRVPFASASIGQVHRATTDDGREVVVKVQYPGVDDAVDSDLASLRLALRASGLVRVDKRALDAVFEEIKARLHEELDYCNEADNVRFFGDVYRDDPKVVVPEVIGERSSGRVLTLAYEPGDQLADIEAYPQALRDELGERLVRTFMGQLFDLRVIHADPNPANFAFRRDGSLVLYDFGCIKRVPEPVIEAYLRTIEAGLREDYDAVERGLLDLGARNPKGPPVPAEHYKLWRDIFVEPFRGPDPFDYGRANLHKEALQHVPVFLAKYLGSFSPPPDLVFVDRVVVGTYGNLKRLGARGQYLPLLEPYLDRVRTS